MAVAIAVHVLAAVIWIGGMFFAYMILRPVAAELLEPPERLTLWRRSFQRFFVWVWAAVLLLPATGYWIIFQVYGGMGTAGLHIHVMQGLGIVMILLYLHVYFAPYRRLCRAVDARDYGNAGRYLNQIRTIVGINLILGVIVVVVATAGQYIF